MKRTTLLYVIVTMLSVLALSCKNEPQKKIRTEPSVFTKECELAIFRGTSDSVRVSLPIEIAETSYETETGLMYRKGMEEKQGMLFIFPEAAPRSFYMKNTEFPLDIVYMNENRHIVSFQENAQPFSEASLPSNAPARYVLEINAGLVNKWGLQTGDSVAFDRL